MKKINVSKIHRDASFSPASISEVDRTVELTWSTGARVLRQPWFDDPYFEELSMDESHIRMDRLKDGAPLLNSHRSGSLDDVIGVVEDAWVSNGQGVARVRFAKDESSEKVFQKVKDGILRKISVGYAIHKMEKQKRPEGQQWDTWRAVDWEPHEVSVVPIPADNGANIRSNEELEFTCELQARSEEETKGVIDMKEKEIEQVTPEEPKAPEVNLEKERSLAQEMGAEQERKRAIEITMLCRKHGVSQELELKFIENKKGIDEVRASILDMIASKEEETEVRTQNVEITVDEKEKFRERMSNAIAHKAGASVELSEGGREFRSLTGMEMIKEFVRRSGHNPSGMSKDELVRRGFHSTSDLPGVLADVMNKEMLAKYKEKPQSFDSFVDRVSHSDFKAHKKYSIGDAPALEKLGENGEVTYGTLKESKEELALESFAKGLKIGRRMFINDDMSALSSVPQSWARKIRQLESNLVWGIINSNPVMGDGFALFSAQHGNLVTVGAGVPIDVTAVAAGELALITQKDLDGEEIELSATTMFVPAARKIEAQQFLSSTIVPATKADVNPFRGNLTPAYESRLDKASALNYYIMADKSQIPMIQLATLDGRGPEVSQDLDFDTEGAKFKVIYDVNAGPVDYRGFVKLIV